MFPGFRLWLKFFTTTPVGQYLVRRTHYPTPSLRPRYPEYSAPGYPMVLRNSVVVAVAAALVPFVAVAATPFVAVAPFVALAPVFPSLVPPLELSVAD